MDDGDLTILYFVVVRLGDARIDSAANAMRRCHSCPRSRDLCERKSLDTRNIALLAYDSYFFIASRELLLNESVFKNNEGVEARFALYLETGHVLSLERTRHAIDRLCSYTNLMSLALHFYDEVL